MVSGSFKKIEWQLPLSWEDGYWYFYSLAYINERVRDEYFLRSSDMREYLLDMDREAGSLLEEEIYHLRTFQSEPHLLRWPLAEVEFEVNIFERLPTTRGSFERPLSMVEHVHLSFDNDNYLLVRQWEGEGLDSLFCSVRIEKNKRRPNCFSVWVFTLTYFRSWVLPVPSGTTHSIFWEGSLISQVLQWIQF